MKLSIYYCYWVLHNIYIYLYDNRPISILRVQHKFLMILKHGSEQYTNLGDIIKQSVQIFLVWVTSLILLGILYLFTIVIFSKGYPPNSEQLWPKYSLPVAPVLYLYCTWRTSLPHTQLPLPTLALGCLLLPATVTATFLFRTWTKKCSFVGADALEISRH